jgi:hypothetical protein
VGVVKLTTIVALQVFYGGAKLSGNKREKISNSGKCVGFEAERKGPQEVGAVIKDGEIVLITRNTGYWRSPQITVDEIKVTQSTRLGNGKRKTDMTTKLTCVTDVGGSRAFIT